MQSYGKIIKKQSLQLLRKPLIDRLNRTQITQNTQIHANKYVNKELAVSACLPTKR